MESSFVIWRMTGLKHLGTSPVTSWTAHIYRVTLCRCRYASLHMCCYILISLYIAKACLWPLIERRVGGVCGGGSVVSPLFRAAQAVRNILSEVLSVASKTLI